MNIMLMFFNDGCQDDSSKVQVVRTPTQTESRDWDEVTKLDASWFARTSLDIRGHRPSEEELEWAQQNSEQLETILDDWVNEDSFAHQIPYWNDVLHTAVWIGRWSVRLV